jgi:hypothetical protein
MICGYAGHLSKEENGGEGGIRTLGTLLEYGALAKRCFRPLSHLTGSSIRLIHPIVMVNRKSFAGELSIKLKITFL